MLNEMESVVREVGAALIKMRDTDAIEGEWQGAQLKTKADILAHELMSKLLKKLDPSIPVVSEEDDASQEIARPAKYWLIDPIDGTASFAGGFDGFVTQVALMENAQPIKATIYAPSLDQLYSAEKGKGAHLNDVALQVVPKRKGKTLIDNYPEARGITAEAYDALSFESYIECGGIALKMCRIADGSADVFFKDIIVRDWDLAAPHLILSEANGYLALINGGSINYTGSFAKVGMIASRSSKLENEIVNWFASR